MNELKLRHAGSGVTIIGRGPSLLSLSAADVGAGPVIALNHAVEQVRRLKLANPLYSLQKDGCLVEPKAPETLILSRTQSNRCWPNYRPRYEVDPPVFKLPRNCMSLTLAVALAGYMGCRQARLLAFDAFTRQDFRTVVGDDLQTIGRGYLHAAQQATKYAKRTGMALEWAA